MESAITAKLRDEDFHAWTEQQAGLLRAGRLQRADLPHLIEEMEDDGSQRTSGTRQPFGGAADAFAEMASSAQSRGRNWQLTIKERRCRLDRHLRDNRSVAARLAEFIVDGYADAILRAERETEQEGRQLAKEVPQSRSGYPQAGFLAGLKHSFQMATHGKIRHRVTM